MVINREINYGSIVNHLSLIGNAKNEERVLLLVEEEYLREVNKYQKIVKHLALIGNANNKEQILLLVEKEYLKEVNKVFWKNIRQELLKNFGKFNVLSYTTDKNTLKAEYFDSLGNKLKRKKLNNVFGKSSLCLDFLTTGEAFYKKGLKIFNKLKRIIVVRLFLENWRLFSYNKKQIKTIGKYTNKVREYLQKQKVFKVKDLQLTIQNRAYLYSNPVNFPSNFRTGDIKILPLDMVTIFTPYRRNFRVIPTKLIINGNLNLDQGLFEIITERKGMITGKLSATIKNNFLIKLEINKNVIRKKDGFKIVHVTFGTNPLINSHLNGIELAERKYGWMCLGAENTERKHIDICLENKLLRPVFNQFISPRLTSLISHLVKS